LVGILTTKPLIFIKVRAGGHEQGLVAKFRIIYFLKRNFTHFWFYWAFFRVEAGENMIHFVRKLRELVPKMIINQPSSVFPQVSIISQNHEISVHSFNKSLFKELIKHNKERCTKVVLRTLKSGCKIEDFLGDLSEGLGVLSHIVG
jgi:hypothetical protein